MAVFVFIFFLLLAIYGALIEFYRRSWNAIPEFTVDGAIAKSSAGAKSVTGDPVYGLTRINDPEHGLTKSDDPEVSVSVIIAVRNEEKNILALIASLEAQDYPRHLYEVILIDDHSEDGTAKLLSEMVTGTMKVFCLSNGDQEHSKKKAIEKGIASASGELILTTDADCRLPSTWISAMAAFYTERGAKFIAAPVTMNFTRSLSGIFQCLDFLTLQGITGASVYKRFHTMCNGANLAYEKKAFQEVNGFEGIDIIPSGDDMLLMHKIFKKYPEQVFYLKSREAIVTTDPERSWGAFFHQRIRWSSKAVHYEDKRIFYVLLLTYLVNVCFAVMLTLCFLHPSYTFLLILLLLAKTIIEYPFVNAVAIFFGQQKLMKYFAVLQPLHIMYIIIAGWLGRFGSYEWKKRKLKNNPGRNPVKM